MLSLLTCGEPDGSFACAKPILVTNDSPASLFVFFEYLSERNQVHSLKGTKRRASKDTSWGRTGDQGLMTAVLVLLFRSHIESFGAEARVV